MTFRRLWRVCKKAYASTAFSGLGAAEFPGRWNTAGHKVVYCAESRSLAMLEILVHVHSRTQLRHTEFVAIPVDVPEEAIAALKKLPRNWDALPCNAATQKAGDEALGDQLAVRVPSVVVRGESCYLINPGHPRFPELRIGKPEPLLFDERLSRDRTSLR